MVIIGMLSYPPESAKEIGKRFLAQKPEPSYLTRKGLYILSKIGEGIQTITIYECENSKLSDGMDYIANRYTAYFGVPGFTYSVQVWFEISEALKMIGMA
jgi:hypothetical protein